MWLQGCAWVVLEERSGHQIPAISDHWRCFLLVLDFHVQPGVNAVGLVCVGAASSTAPGVVGRDVSGAS